MPLIHGLALLLTYQLIGEVGVHALGLPIPGPVLGMLLLFLTLVAWGRVPSRLETTANGLLGHLSLLFVPAGVGLMVHAVQIGQEWLAIASALVVSTVVTMTLTAWTVDGAKWLASRWRQGRG